MALGRVSRLHPVKPTCEVAAPHPALGINGARSDTAPKYMVYVLSKITTNYTSSLMKRHIQRQGFNSSYLDQGALEGKPQSFTSKLLHQQLSPGEVF